MQTKTRHTALILCIVAAGLALLAVIGFIIIFYVNKWSIDIPMEGEETVTLEYGDDYSDPGARALLRGSMLLRNGYELYMTTSGEVNTQKLGTYEIVYEASAFWTSRKAVRTVHVVDTQPPVITLTETDLLVMPGDPYVEEGFSAADNVDGDITDNVKRTENGSTVHYEVSDSSGNYTECFREIRYANLPPELTLLGDEVVYLTAGYEPYIDAGCTAQDEKDGDLTAEIKIEGTVNHYQAGDYELVYSVTDSEGTENSVCRHVIVSAVGQPEQVIPEGKVIYLTFDDGPSKNTARLLDILDRNGVKATFFVTNVISEYSYMIPEIFRRGHSIGVHTQTHDYDLIYSSEDAFFADFRYMQDLIAEMTGETTTLLRFPGGSSNTVSCFNPGIMSTLTQDVTDLGLQYFDWNVSAGDADAKATKKTILQNVKDGIKTYRVAVVLQHDTSSISVDCVNEIIQYGRSQGAVFMALGPDSPTAHHGIAN